MYATKVNQVLFDSEQLKISIKSDRNELFCELDLNKFSHNPNISEIVRDISGEDWCDFQTLDALTKILDQVCSKQNNYCKPGIFCPFGN